MSRWRLLLATGACCSLALLFTACGGGDGGATASAAPSEATPGTTGGTPTPADSKTPASGNVDTTTEPQLEGPASRYSLLNPEDFGPGYITDIRNTYTLDAKNYTAHNEAFPSPQEGEEMMNAWGYEGGYSTAVDPENRVEGMLNGGVRVLLEVHLFETEQGAADAYTYFADHIRSSGVVAPVGINPVGNEFAAWTYRSGKVGNSNINLAFFVVMFRRGNLVSSVVAMGAEPFLRADHARAHAVMIDQKALGDRAVFTPTPTGNYTPQPSR